MEIQWQRKKVLYYHPKRIYLVLMLIKYEDFDSRILCVIENHSITLLVELKFFAIRLVCTFGVIQ